MKFLQIIPAQPGWHVVYKAGGGVESAPGTEESGGVIFVPVACWGLTEGGRVVPLTGGNAGAALEGHDPSDGALGVAPPGRRPRDWWAPSRPSRARGTSRHQSIKDAEPASPSKVVDATTDGIPGGDVLDS